MKTTYSAPEIEILIIESSQVVTASGDASYEEDKTVGLPFDKFD